MQTLKTWLYLLAFSLLNAHELDAMTQQEWRLLLILRDLPAALARETFVMLHVPLVALLLWLSFHRDAAVAAWSRRAVCGFGIIHVGLHWNLQDHPAYTFDSTLSVSLILGYGVAGLLYLLLDGLDTRQHHAGRSR